MTANCFGLSRSETSSGHAFFVLWLHWKVNESRDFELSRSYFCWQVFCVTGDWKPAHFQQNRGTDSFQKMDLWTKARKGRNCLKTPLFGVKLWKLQFQIDAFLCQISGFSVSSLLILRAKKKGHFGKVEVSEFWFPCTPGLHEAAQFLSLETINRSGPRRKVIFQPAKFQVLS